MKINYLFLLEKETAEDFFTENSVAIFGQDLKIKIIDFKRAYTYNPDSYNIFYHLSVNGTERKVRISTSRAIDKEPDFQVLDFFYQNGFASGEILTAKPLAFIKKKNILVYEHVDGTVLMEKLNSDLDILKEWIKQASLALKKIHVLPRPDFQIWDYHKFFYFNAGERNSLKKYYPETESSLDAIIKKISELIEKNKNPVVCHGDFQPANLLLSGEKMYILDLDLVTFLDKEYDITVFISQLFYMTKRFGNFENFEILKNIFLDNYGPVDHKKLVYYEALINLRTLSVFCLSQGREENSEFIPLTYQRLKNNLDQIENA
jgi:aminoglycoside phosphotransferase